MSDNFTNMEHSSGAVTFDAQPGGRRAAVYSGSATPNRPNPAYLAGAVIILMIAILVPVFFYFGNDSEREQPGNDNSGAMAGDTSAMEESVGAPLKEVYLYGIGPGGLLVTSKIMVPMTGITELDAASLVGKLIHGPGAALPAPALEGNQPQPPFISPLPEKTGLRGVYFDQDGTVIIDLSLPPTATGILAELAAVHSIANTVTMNIPGVRLVRIILNGADAESFYGHVDISRPIGFFEEYNTQQG